MWDHIAPFREIAQNYKIPSHVRVTLTFLDISQDTVVRKADSFIK